MFSPTGAVVQLRQKAAELEQGRSIGSTRIENEIKAPVSPHCTHDAHIGIWSNGEMRPGLLGFACGHLRDVTSLLPRRFNRAHGDQKYLLPAMIVPRRRRTHLRLFVLRICCLKKTVVLVGC